MHHRTPYQTERVSALFVRRGDIKSYVMTYAKCRENKHKQKHEQGDRGGLVSPVRSVLLCGYGWWVGWVNACPWLMPGSQCQRGRDGRCRCVTNPLDATKHRHDWPE